jgi:hypothetical protein
MLMIIELRFLFVISWIRPKFSSNREWKAVISLRIHLTG